MQFKRSRKFRLHRRVSLLSYRLGAYSAVRGASISLPAEWKRRCQHYVSGAFATSERGRLFVLLALHELRKFVVENLSHRINETINTHTLQYGCGIGIPKAAHAIVAPRLDRR